MLPWAAPAYDGACLTQLLPSAVASLTRTQPVLPIPPADRIVVLLVDGLGHLLLPLAGDQVPYLAQMTPLVPDGIDVVFPSTTAASLTSLGTGLPPGGHGIVGASFWLPELGRALLPLRWRDQPNATAVQPERTVFQRAEAMGIAVTIVGPRSFAGSGLTAAALRGGRYLGADSVGETVVGVAAAAGQAPPALVYGYFSTVDKSGHVHGVGSEQWLLDLQHTDRAIAQIAERLPPGTLLLVTGDHGMINCPDEARIDIDAPWFADGVRAIAGEPRMRHVYLRPGASGSEVAQRWQDRLGDRAVVLTRDTAVAAGLFGDLAAGIADRIGDVLALATDDNALVSEKVDSIVSSLRGQHGGLTELERRVPLLAARAG